MTTLAFFGIVGWIVYFLFFEEIATMSTNIHSVETTKSVNANQVTQIEVHTDSADIHITPTNNQEQIVATLTGKISDTYKDRFAIHMLPSGDKLQINIKEKKKWAIGFHINNVQVELQIPQKIYETLTLKTNSGSIHGDSLQIKKLVAVTNTGDVRIKNISGKTINLQTKQGDVALTSAVATNTKLDTESGNIIADFIQNENIHISSISGDIKLREIKGSSVIQTKSGDTLFKQRELTNPISIYSKSGDTEIAATNVPAVQFHVISKSGTYNVQGSSLQYQEQTPHRLRASAGENGPVIKIESDSGNFLFH
ncbi:DUF4097 domain-containing protein [Ectobacillus sp. JY-23]|uniref:DUF4097 family beta strand repeat-containing protein n=1 Tax=Ectobacillus sp. JY-23 TaxID=2933872 RepID=UPI001FF64166|nr:DUF4097 family beta strand repeat-containing protein [Ectobacillus sp. JY-23]UOY94093.1 DUF4097 domain-containing protein [Ectobacillus sp. JY-23]